MSNIVTITRNFNNVKIKQRKSDGYLNASDMCKATGKRWPDYRRLDNVQEFLDALSLDTKIPVVQIPTTEQNQGLIETIQGGTPEKQGTWVHPRVAVNLAQWCSPEFAVLVSEWVVELLTTGHVELTQPATPTEPSSRLEKGLTCRLAPKLLITVMAHLSKSMKSTGKKRLIAKFTFSVTERRFLLIVLVTLHYQTVLSSHAKTASFVLIAIGGHGQMKIFAVLEVSHEKSSWI